MSMIDIPIGPNGDLDFSGVEVIEDDLGDHDGLAIDLDLLELYEILEAGRIIRPLVQRRSATDLLRAVPRAIGSSPFVSRQACGLRAPRSTTKLTTARGNTGHWEGPEMGWPWDHSQCPAKVRGIQAFHMSKGWADIAYSSMECGHGSIFECRWYGLRTAANGTNLGNDRSYAHCALIGQNDAVSDELKRAQRDAVVYFEGRGSGDDKNVHSDWKPTACNGSLRDYWKAGLPAPVVVPDPQPEPPQGDDFVLPATFGQGTPDSHHTGIMQSALIWHARDAVAYAMGGFDKVENFPDGDFGPATTAVLSTWQKRTGYLRTDGVCDAATYKHLVGV